MPQGFVVFIRNSEPQLKRCHSKPQLKECHVFFPYPETQLKEHSNKLIFKVSPKTYKPRKSKQVTNPDSALSCRTTPKPLGVVPNWLAEGPGCQALRIVVLFIFQLLLGINFPIVR
ncbi:hypothetical protein DEO72_LG4g930 [Vigna unguiculata]|uniref:Uncharacterized protein n=1 Tax=Vigna unguiculata TaxID=3917 RepID=A0A4D6LNE3_VIGUN|nr:hypothetical protein DEO72_LG4g930 [Vigna unguiculata]